MAISLMNSAFTRPRVIYIPFGSVKLLGIGRQRFIQTRAGGLSALIYFSLPDPAADAPNDVVKYRDQVCR
jgi:hypothetical protein